MNEKENILEVIDERGEIGLIEQSADAPTGENLLPVRLGDGAQIFVEANLLTKTASDEFRYAGSFQNASRRLVETATDANQSHADQTNFNRQNSAAINAERSEAGEIVVPLVAEEISVSKKTVETGGVRVHKIVREEVRRIDEPIIREHLEVERVEINQFVETAPNIRYEGDVMIVPVLEEVVVTQKRLLLREEVRLIKRREEIANAQEVVLRREEINLERIDSGNSIEPGEPER